ncbi:hypothetical protein [Myceligenerans salitolerans]|uniref:Uncharacterized protein n=1 Tax=Myceligenerans salitolerans TaxID=1230528 RepID=A0ABS3IFL1_9MICO|nr:hypothetical protein [Myceligenerans salitolerans]MBO0611189.1 hypothetical protein [Myceligenerans salitolerans]
MSTLDATFTATFTRPARHGQDARALATAPSGAREGEREHRASRGERRRQDSARHARDIRRKDQLERARDNAAARHPLSLR